MNKFEMSPEQIKADEEAIAIIREKNAMKQRAEESATKKIDESFDWNEGDRVMDTDTAKVLAKERVASDKNAAQALLERIKKGFR